MKNASFARESRKFLIQVQDRKKTIYRERCIVNGNYEYQSQATGVNAFHDSFTLGTSFH